MPSDQQSVQRFLTVEFITKRRLKVQAIWLRPEAASPSAEDAVKPTEKLACDPNEWTDERNLGARLADGFIELKIQSPDDIWTQCLFKAFRSLGVDARAAYGIDGRPISSILFRIDDPDTIDGWENKWPTGHRDQAGQWVATKFVYSLAPTARAKAAWRNSSPLPGSLFGGCLVQWRPFGKPAAEDPELGLEDLEPREIAATRMDFICRAIAFATLGYYVQTYLDGLTQWDESLIRTVGGWLAKLILEGVAINDHGKTLEGVCWAPIDNVETANQLLTYLEKYHAPRELEVAFSHAQSQLERNPQAYIPGWKAIETCFGPHARSGLRAAFKAGLDIDVIEQLSERYFYDLSLGEFIDREALLQSTSDKFVFPTNKMMERYETERFWVNSRKSVNLFKIYLCSKLRSDVWYQDFFPHEEPGGILRYHRLHRIVKGEERFSGEYLVFNTFRGFNIKPVPVINPTIMQLVITQLDRMLGLLTKDHDERMVWLKKFIAHIIQFPNEKPQVCPIIVGGQGIGKSMFGLKFMHALFGGLAGSANASTLDDKFVIEPFLWKLVTFIDEARLESATAVNTIKKLIRSTHMAGEQKYGHQREYYIPSRLIVATNHPNLGLTSEDALDRTFYFIMAATADNMKMSEGDFLEWTAGLRPFYQELVKTTESIEALQHLMRYFMEIEVERMELEDLKHSSRNDPNVIMPTMSRTRQIARQMVADAHIIYSYDITAWFTEMNVRDAIRRYDGNRSRVEAHQVLREFDRAGIVDTARGGYYKFRWGYGKLLKEFGQAHRLPIMQSWDFRPGDFDDNPVMSTANPPPWRGLKHGQPQQEPRYRDPDEMDPE